VAGSDGHERRDTAATRTYLVECYSPGVGRANVESDLFSSGSKEVVHEASTRAAVPFERVVESIAVGQNPKEQKEEECSRAH
jgi:hypothetical protein